MKTVIIESIITPFEIARFNVINEKLNNNLLVFFQNQSDVGRGWRFNLGGIKFDYKVLPDIPIRMGRRDIFTLHTNYTTFSELKKASPNIVISCGWDSLASYMAYLYCKIHNKKFILWAGSTINEQSWRRAVSKPLVKFLVRNSDACIAYGTRAKEYLMHLGAKKERIFIGWNTVDNSFFETTSPITAEEKDVLKLKLGIKNRLVILTVGRLVPGKGIDTLLEAFSCLKKEVNDVSLLIVGSGPEEDSLKRKCVQDNIDDIIFAGFVDYNEMPKYFGISDLFVFPSFIDIWGLVINEAMACGLPVITTEKVGASVDLVKNGINGFVIKEKAPSELYDAMRKIVTDNELRLKMAASSRQIISNFNLEHTAEGIKAAISYACLEK